MPLVERLKSRITGLKLFQEIDPKMTPEEIEIQEKQHRSNLHNVSIQDIIKVGQEDLASKFYRIEPEPSKLI